jgi:hypothetical protein
VLIHADNLAGVINFKPIRRWIFSQFLTNGFLNSNQDNIQVIVLDGFNRPFNNLSRRVVPPHGVKSDFHSQPSLVNSMNFPRPPLENQPAR